MAVNRQRPQNDLIFHSDRGVQYASYGYREALAEYNITQSMSRKGEPYDNAVADCAAIKKYCNTRSSIPLTRPFLSVL